MPRAPRPPSYTEFTHANEDHTRRLAEIWRGDKHAWGWTTGVGRAIVSKEGVWEGLSLHERQSVLAKLKILDSELTEGNLKREEWEDSQAKWEDTLRSWLPERLWPGPLKQIYTLSSDWLYYDTFHIQIPVRLRREYDLPLHDAKMTFIESLNELWGQWAPVRQRAASKLARLYANHIMKTRYDTRGFEPAQVAQRQFRTAVPPLEVFLSFLPFLMLVIQIPNRSTTWVDNTIDKKLVPFLIELSSRWEDWSSTERSGLVASLGQVESKARAAVPLHLDDLFQNLARLEGGLNLIHLRTAGYIDDPHQPSLSDHFEHFQTLASIGHRSALHHGTTKARWEAQWA